MFQRRPQVKTLIIPAQNYRIVNNTYFDYRTPKEVIDVLEYVRINRIPITFQYGDFNTGKSFGHFYRSNGHIVRTTGIIKLPVVLRKIDAPSGRGLHDAYIVLIFESKTGEVLYKHPDYYEEN